MMLTRLATVSSRRSDGSDQAPEKVPPGICYQHTCADRRGPKVERADHGFSASPLFLKIARECNFVALRRNRIQQPRVLPGIIMPDGPLIRVQHSILLLRQGCLVRAISSPARENCVGTSVMDA